NEIPRSVPRRTTSGARATVGALLPTAAAEGASGDWAAGVGGAVAGALPGTAGAQARARPTVLPAARRTKSRRGYALKAPPGAASLTTSSPDAGRLRRWATEGSPPPLGV